VISSPLRYPGGKAKLFPFFSELMRVNDINGVEYCEPYAGGAGLALRLLTNGIVSKLHLNGVDISVYAFWKSIMEQTDRFCRLLEKTPVTVDEWRRQKLVYSNAGTGEPLELGFATYFLNRTNRSWIIEGAGPIGGYSQSGL
jgi:DNA adenine methylase